MAILMRGGGYLDFDPSKLRPREWAVVLQDDPSARDGKAVYICFAAGNVKRISTYEDMKDDLITATDDVIEQYVQIFGEIKTEVERLRSETLGYKNTAQAKAGEAESFAQTASEKSQASSVSAANSANSADLSEEYSLRSKSYAVGTSGEVRPNDGTDNSKYYKEECQRLYQNIEQLISSVTTGGLIPAGTVSFLELPLVPNLGYMYNISDDFVTDERFEDGAGKYYSSGTNVYWTASEKWDVLTGVAVLGVKGESEALYQTGYVNITKESMGLDKVENKTSREILEGLTSTDVTNALGYIPGSGDGGVTGVKGEAEETYRSGNVNITKTDIGLGNVDNTADADKPISTAQQTELDKKANKADIVPNSRTTDGYVTKGEGNPNKVWGTDDNGNVGWQFPQSDSGDNYASKSIYGDTSVSLGRKNGTAIGKNSFAFGYNVTASGDYSHAEGSSTTASAYYSHAEGGGTTASGDNAHAEGFKTIASGYYSHAEGYGTIAGSSYCHAGGYYNNDGISNVDDEKIFMIGCGESYKGSNVFRVSSNATYGKTYSTEGADYAEFFEWKDGNPNHDDRRGLFVTIDGEGIRLAKSADDYIVGIVSGNPSVIGDSAAEDWKGQYVTDIFGKIQYENIEEIQSNGETRTARVRKISRDFDPKKEYIPRERRREWDAVGMMGKLVAVDDGTCAVNGYCYPNANGIATNSDKRTKFRVISRIDDAHIKVLIL